jgi:hypothetical protein
MCASHIELFTWRDEMSYKTEITSVDLDWQVEAIRWFPEIANKVFYPAMWHVVRAVAAEIKPNIPRSNGEGTHISGAHAADMFKTAVTGSGLNIQGRVGWWGKDQPFWMNILEYGARTHSILPGTGIRTRQKRKSTDAVSTDFGIANSSGVHINVNGMWVTKRSVAGFAPRRFMKEGFDAAQEIVNDEMQKAGDEFVNQLAVK